MPPTVSTRKGIDVTWSRCEWVMKMESICESSASVRSPTPVPASIRMSLSSRNEVVRRCRPPIPPEQPRMRSFTAMLLFVERRHPRPARGRRRFAEFGGSFRVEGVDLALGVHALQVEQVDLDLVPLLRAVGAQGLVPELQLVERLLVDVALQADRLVHVHRGVLALDLDEVELLVHHV